MSTPPNNPARRYWTFIGLLVLVCAIPGVIYFSLSKTLGSYSASDIPSGAPPAPGNQNLSTLQASNATISATVRFTQPPVTVGKNSWILTLKELGTGQPLNQQPTVDALMPMGKYTMSASTHVVKASRLGEYSGQTDFTMGGPWLLEVRAGALTKTPLQLKLLVLEK